MRSARGIALALAVSSSSPVAAALAPAGAELLVVPPAFASEAVTHGCWARLFLAPGFASPALTLIGPVEVDYVARDWGFAWDARYKSVRVGPRATLTLYDDPKLRDQTAVFGAGRSIADLDTEMGIFRSIRSLKVSCT